jgi:hypothetical protein
LSGDDCDELNAVAKPLTPVKLEPSPTNVVAVTVPLTSSVVVGDVDAIPTRSFTLSTVKASADPMLASVTALDIIPSLSSYLFT